MNTPHVNTQPQIHSHGNQMQAPHQSLVVLCIISLMHLTLKTAVTVFWAMLALATVALPDLYGYLVIWVLPCVVMQHCRGFK